MSRTAQVVTRINFIFLKLYPRHFLEEYGAEMAAVFSENCQAEEGSPLAVLKLCLRELRDLPVNLIREHWSEFKRSRHMQSQPDLKQSYFGIILRSALGYGFGFALIYLLYCLIDTLFNSGNTLWQEGSIWGVLYLHPSALAVALGTLIAGNWKSKRQGWGAAAAAFVGYTLFFRISRLAVASLITSIDYFLLQFAFLMLLGMIVAGGIGIIQHGKKSVGWYALAGGTGFNIGWLIDNDISQYILRQNMATDLSRLVVGSPTYYLYFLLPSLFWGAVIGACLGIAAGAERMKKPVYLPA